MTEVSTVTALAIVLGLLQVVLITFIVPLRKSLDSHGDKLSEILRQVSTINGRVGKLEQLCKDHQDLDDTRFSHIEKRLDNVS